MKTVIVSCSPYGNLKNIVPLLQQAGLEQQNDAFIRWHDTFLGPSGSVKPLIGDLEALPQAQAEESIAAMLSASSGDHLLLTDSRCLWTLDYWAEKLPEATFLLFYSRAEAALTSAAQQGFKAELALNDWQAAGRQLVKFHRGNRRRAFLIEIEAAIQNPQALLDIFRRIGLSPQPLQHPIEPVAEQPLVELYLARQLVAEHPAVQALQTELEASSQPLGEAVPPEIPLLALFNEQRIKLESVQHAQSAWESTSKQSAQENELLLLQLHQMQDELEETFLEKRQLEQQKQKDDAARQRWQTTIDQLQTQIDQLTKACDQQAKVNTNQQAELEKARQEKNASIAASKESAEENELLLLQLHQIQEELEKTFLEKEQLEQQNQKDEVARQQWQATIDQLESQVDQLAKARDQQAKVNTNQRAELERFRQEKKASIAASKESAKENELLLQRLHQVLEELEKIHQQKEQLEKKEQKGQATRQQLQSQVDKLQSQIAKLTKARDQQAKVNTNQRSELDKFRQEKKSSIAAAKESAKENQRLLQRLHQMQEELEKTYLQKEQLEKNEQKNQITRQQLQSQIDQLQTQIVQLTEAHDQQFKMNTDQRTELEKVRQAHESLEAASKEITQENEILLQQLQEVQEGLEKTFLQKQQLERQKKQLERQKQQLEQQLEQQKLQLEQQLEQQKLQLEHQTQQLVETVKNEKDLELQQVKDELLSRAKELERLHQRETRLKQSMSWKITAPMRVIAKPFSKMSKDETKIREQVKLLRFSGLFDEAWYTATNNDVADDGYDPVEHYIRYGAAEGRDPSPVFSTQRYLEINPDVAENGMNPLVHFVKYGQAEKRNVDNPTGEDKPVEP